MKAFIFALSLTGLIMGTSISKADTTTSDENVAVFKTQNQTEELKTQKPQTGTHLWLRVLASLGIVIALFGGGIYLLKKLPNTNRFTNKSKMIQVLSQHYLGAKKSLAVVRVAGETVLIGITDENISHLKTLSLLDEDLTSTKKFDSALGKKIQEDNEEFKINKGAFRV
ncbi:MAG: flagellar biosynthetic protein FliO [Oligoflexia bacterium]|nr:flagellar biosynthetic protein FliO [Oligoflexia bacterium]